MIDRDDDKIYEALKTVGMESLRIDELVIYLEVNCNGYSLQNL